MLHRSLVLASFAVMVAGSASAATEKFHATLDGGVRGAALKVDRIRRGDRVVGYGDARTDL